MALVSSSSSSAARLFRGAAVAASSHLAPSTSYRRVQPPQQLLPAVRSIRQPRLSFYRRVHVQAAMSQATETSSKDIIERIKTDHSELDDYYKQYKSAVKAGSKDDALKWFNQFVWEVSRHSVSEELVLYPMLERFGEKGRNLADKSRSDHHKVKELLAEMQSISDPFEFEPKMDLMMKELREHIKLEESEDLKIVQEQLTLSERETAGATFALGKNIAPTRPHTAVPEKPVIIEAALGLLATPVDKLRDLFTSFPDKKDLNQN